jgi:2-polyprenyl-3-methyl-5-hydroxy-6-metoxy-1,4-benzoquinol methylase
MALITLEDFKETFIRFWQKGVGTYASKLFKGNSQRTIKTFDAQGAHANWWLLPQVHNLINKRQNIGQLQHYMQLAILNAINNCGYNTLNILSVGCGNGSQEFLWLKHSANCNIDAIDITPKNIDFANNQAAQLGINNINFIVSSWEQYDSQKKYDIILFHSSMHHLANIEAVFTKIKTLLSTNGLLVLHEYVGAQKHQFTQQQISMVNQLLSQTPKHLKKMFNTPFYKYKVQSPGRLRMYLNDPSEAIESQNIRPALKKYTQALFEQELGANLFVLYLKEIAHHFINITDENEALLNKVFMAEEEFIKNKQSDFIFGIYKFK